MKLKQIVPLAGFVFIQPDENVRKTSSGILLSEDAEEKTYLASVLAVGKAKSGEEMECKVGDRVLYNKWPSNKVTIERIEYQFLRITELLAIVKK